MKKILTTTLFMFISLLVVPCFAQTLVFYGMTPSGGSLNDGAIIRFNPSTNAEDTVHSFGRGDDGVRPYGDLVYDATNQLFYGMTSAGGSLNDGAIIRFNPSTNAEDTVHSFGRGMDGTQPDGDLVYDASNGLFYAMTHEGGSLGLGAIISFNPLTNAEDTVHSFGRGMDGAFPHGNLVYDATNQLFYGMMGAGGSLNEGVIISFNPSTNAEAIVWSFGSGDDGAEALGNLVYDATTQLFYGMTNEGGSVGLGAIISFNPSTDVEDTVHSFGRGMDGQYPAGDLVYDATNQLFYAMTEEGGSLNQGTIISFNPLTNAEDTVHSFGRGTDGQHPDGDLVYDATNQLFYGTTAFGGGINEGTIISFNPSTNAEAAVWIFGHVTGDGALPEGNLVSYNLVTSVDDISSSLAFFKVFPNPNNGVFTIQLPAVNNNSIVEIYNTLGEKVLTETLSNAQGNNMIDIGQQPNGIYLYRIISETGSSIGEGKVIVAK